MLYIRNSSLYCLIKHLIGADRESAWIMSQSQTMHPFWVIPMNAFCWLLLELFHHLSDFCCLPFRSSNQGGQRCVPRHSSILIGYACKQSHTWAVTLQTIQFCQGSNPIFTINWSKCAEFLTSQGWLDRATRVCGWQVDKSMLSLKASPSILYIYSIHFNKEDDACIHYKQNSDPLLHIMSWGNLSSRQLPVTDHLTTQSLEKYICISYEIAFPYIAVYVVSNIHLIPLTTWNFSTL